MWCGQLLISLCTNHPVLKLFLLCTCTCGTTNERCRSAEQWPCDQEVFKYVSSIYFFQLKVLNCYSRIQIYKLHKDCSDNTSQRIWNGKQRAYQRSIALNISHYNIRKNTWTQVVKYNYKNPTAQTKRNLLILALSEILMEEKIDTWKLH